ncbi:hypothetical protein AAVH_25436 [Aphelenchoides avenae]|nr:hypothetical protein AAVH_25436 [Aphelenchus avenae]
MVFGQGEHETEYPTNGALLKDMFVRRVHVNGRNEDIVRWFFTVLPRMHMDQLEITVPAATRDFQEQLFSVLRCRQITVTLGGSTGPAVPVLPDDIVTLMFREKRNADNDVPSDVVVGPRSFKTQSGYERSLYMTAGHVGEGGVKQLVAALREKAVSATEACPPFLVYIAWAKLEAHKLPPMRHLNRATGQHFVVNCDEERSTMIKCINVLRPRK